MSAMIDVCISSNNKYRTSVCSIGHEHKAVSFKPIFNSWSDHWLIQMIEMILYLPGQTLPLVLSVSAGRRPQQVPDPAGESISRHDVCRRGGRAGTDPWRSSWAHGASVMQDWAPAVGTCGTNLLYFPPLEPHARSCTLTHAPARSRTDVLALPWKHQWRSWRL